MTAETRAPETGWRRQHWEQIYRAKAPESVSWYQPRLSVSLRLIEATGAGHDARIIDVGGGNSTLVEHLRALGYRNLTVLDIAGTAIRQARQRLGADADAITWIEGDVLNGTTEDRYDIWHDRAVFHFLTEAEDRDRYVSALTHALSPGGHVVMATFAADGPTHCSGLAVIRYTPRALAQALGSDFRLIESATETHHTPNGVAQRFVYCRFIRARGRGPA